MTMVQSGVSFLYRTVQFKCVFACFPGNKSF